MRSPHPALLFGVLVTSPHQFLYNLKLWFQCDLQPLSVYQVKVKVKRMLGAVRKYERQAARGQLFVDKPFYYDTIKTLFRKELKPYQVATITSKNPTLWWTWASELKMIGALAIPHHISGLSYSYTNCSQKLKMIGALALPHHLSGLSCSYTNCSRKLIFALEILHNDVQAVIWCIDWTVVKCDFQYVYKMRKIYVGDFEDYFNTCMYLMFRAELLSRCCSGENVSERDKRT